MLDHLESWTTLLSTEKSRLTARNYRSRIDKWFVPWLKKDMKKLRASDVWRFREHLIVDKRLHPSLVNTILAAIRSFWAYLQSKDIVSNNIFVSTGLAVKNPRLLPKPMSSDDVRKIFCLEKDPELRFLLILGFFAGLRLNEALQVKHADFNFSVDPPELMVKFGKGNKERITIILPYVNVVKESRFYLSNHKRLFTYSRDMIFKKIKGIAERIRVGWFTFHKCRHTFATQLGKSGIGDDMIADLMGHSSTATTKGYRQISLSRIRSEVLNKFGAAK